MRTDKNGVSTCIAGQEYYEYFDYMGRKRVQYEYRSTLTGDLFTCAAVNLDLARERRDIFLKEEQRKAAEAERRFNLNHPELNP